MSQSSQSTTHKLHQSEIGISYTVRRNSRARSITIRVLPTGTVLVTAPPRVSVTEISRVVDRSKGWIEKQLSKASHKTRSATPYLQLFGEDWLLRPYRLDDREDDSVIAWQEGARRELRVLDLHCQTEQMMLKTIIRWIKSTATTEISRMVRTEAKEMGVKFSSISFKDTRSRWGSCSSTGALSFSWRLLHMSRPVIRYVVIHELAHLEFMDHSSRFWSFVERYDPEYKAHRRYLKQHTDVAHSLELAVASAYALYNGDR